MTGKAEEIWFDAFAQSNADNVRGKTKTRNILRGTKGQVRNILTGPENAFGGKETDGQGFIVSRRSHSDRNATGHGKVILTSISETYLKRFLDRNKVQLSATTSDALNIEPLADKWKAFNWDVLECDGHDMAAVVETLERARDMSSNGPVVIIAHTVKGKGVSFMEGRWQWHGIPPNDEQFEQAMSELTQGGAQ